MLAIARGREGGGRLFSPYASFPISHPGGLPEANLDELCQRTVVVREFVPGISEPVS